MKNAIIINGVIYEVVENKGKGCECESCAFFERCKDDCSGQLLCDYVFESPYIHFEIKKEGGVE